MEIVANEHLRGAKLKRVHSTRDDGARKSLMFEGKNIHSSPVDGKLLCSYSEKVCMQRRLNGFAFCIRHILEDKGAPFKQCQFFAKYNKSRCINPVPISEDRDYCNSHMQVLGIIPKKFKKRNDGGDRLLTNKEMNAKTMKNTRQRHHVDGKSWICSKRADVTKNHSSAMDYKSNMRYENVANRASRNHGKKIMPPLRWPPYGHIWKKLIKRQRAGNHVDWEASGDPDVRKLSHLFKRRELEFGDLFRIYMFDRPEDEISDWEEISLRSDATEGYADLLIDYSTGEIKSNLKHQKAQLKQSIKARMQDRNMTYSVLQSLVNAAKANAVQTANILKSNESHKCFRDRRCGRTNVRCAASLMPNVRCSKQALPYSRHCIKHISSDEDQVLYGCCTARFAAGPQCGLPVVDLINERPLCSEHSLKKLSSASRETSLPAKRVKKPEKGEKSRSKVPPARKNLKAKLQKKFAIPNKPMRKSNSHIGNSITDEDRSPLEKNNTSKMILKPSSVKWVLGDHNNDAERCEGGIVAPRSGYEPTADALSPASSDLAFDINAESLSSPSLMSEEEDRYPLMAMGRKHHDSFTFDDDEDLLQSNAFAINRMSDNGSNRDVTSPQITHFPAESLGNSLSLGELCSPAKLALEKQMFGSSSVIKQEASASCFSSRAGGRRESFNTNHPAIGSVRSNGILSPQHTLVPEDRYIISDSNPTVSVALSSNLDSLSSTSATWATKFTLPTRSDQLAVTSVGFIRVDPSSHNTIYSPPFTSPTLPNRSKADFFKFETNSKQLENDNGVSTRTLPSYTAAIRGLERKFDVEPPLQKVNPDIFLSTMYTVTESSNT